MIRQFTASLFQEDGWVIAQCLEIDIASQGETESIALANLKEALALHFEEPFATEAPSLQVIEVKCGAAAEALMRLESLRGTAKLGDLVCPIDTEWNAERFPACGQHT